MRKRFNPNKVFFSKKKKKDNLENLSEQEQHQLTGGHGTGEPTEYDWADQWDEGTAPDQSATGAGESESPLMQPMGWEDGEDWEEDEDEEDAEGGGQDEEDEEDEEIKSLLKDYPVAAALLEKLPGLENNLAKIIREKFVGNDEFNITFRAKELESDLDGVYHTNIGNFSESTVTINTHILMNSSQEYILVTMYHEALHAFLNIEEYDLGPEQFAAKYPDVSKVQNGDKFEYLAGL